MDAGLEQEASERDEPPTVAAGHGRPETRPSVIFPAPATVDPEGRWRDRSAVGMALPESTDSQGRGRLEPRASILSVLRSAKEFAGAVRGPWSIETNRHWPWDASFREDESRGRRDQAPATLGVIRRFALGLLKRATSCRRGIETRRLKCAVMSTGRKSGSTHEIKCGFLAPGPEPPQRRAIVKGITRESLAVILADNLCGRACDPDETSGWVAAFNEYKGKGGSDRQFWLSVWGCALVSVDRKGGRNRPMCPTRSLRWSGQCPAMLGGLSEERGRDDGFLDRCLFAFPDRSAFPSQRWTRAGLSEAAERDWAETITQLHDFPMVVDSKTQTLRPFYVGFTSEAEQVWSTWFDTHADESDAPEFSDDLAGAWSKMKAHAARFALILYRLRWGLPSSASRHNERARS